MMGLAYSNPPNDALLLARIRSEEVEKALLYELTRDEDVHFHHPEQRLVHLRRELEEGLDESLENYPSFFSPNTVRDMVARVVDAVQEVFEKRSDREAFLRENYVADALRSACLQEMGPDDLFWPDVTSMVPPILESLQLNLPLLSHGCLSATAETLAVHHLQEWKAERRFSPPRQS